MTSALAFLPRSIPPAAGYGDGYTMPVFMPLPELDLGQIYRGDTVTVPIWEARDQTGRLIDLSGASVWFTGKTDLAHLDSEPTAIRRTTSNGGVALIAPTEGLYQITIDPSSTSNLLDDTVFIFDVQVRTPDTVTATVQRGILTVIRDVTRAMA